MMKTCLHILWLTPCLLLLFACTDDKQTTHPELLKAAISIESTESDVLPVLIDAVKDEAGIPTFRWAVTETDPRVKYILCVYELGKDCNDAAAIRYGIFDASTRQFRPEKAWPEKYRNASFKWSVLGCYFDKQWRCFDPEPKVLASKMYPLAENSAYVMVYNTDSGTVMARSSTNGVDWEDAMPLNPGQYPASRSPAIAQDGEGNLLAVWKFDVYVPYVPEGANHIALKERHHLAYKRGQLVQDTEKPHVIWEQNVEVILPADDYACRDVPDATYYHGRWVIICREPHRDAEENANVLIFRTETSTTGVTTWHKYQTGVKVNRYTTPRLSSGTRLMMTYAYKTGSTVPESFVKIFRYRTATAVNRWSEPKQFGIPVDNRSEAEQTVKKGRLHAIYEHAGAFYITIGSADSTRSYLLQKQSGIDPHPRVLETFSFISTSYSPAFAIGANEFGSEDVFPTRCEALVIYKPKQGGSYQTRIAPADVEGGSCRYISGFSINPNKGFVEGVVSGSGDSRWRADVVYSHRKFAG